MTTGAIIDRRALLLEAGRFSTLALGALAACSRAAPVAQNAASTDPITLDAPAPTPILTPEQFGARGDSRSDDTAAFQAASAALNRAGGGTLRLRAGAVYRVGRQTALGAPIRGYTFLPADIVKLVGCTRPILIDGRGATLRATDGYRYGTFDAAGRATRRPQPFYGPELAAGYAAMIEVEGCVGEVLIRDVTLDGNIARARIGGGWDDKGWQVPGSGLMFRNNRGRWRCERVIAHGHGLDGVMVDDPGTPATVASGSGTSDCDFFENGRQGMSIVGGVGLRFARTSFRRTGRAGPIASPPGAGVDLEAEGGKQVREILFEDCAFLDNHGAGLLYGGGPVSRLTVRRSHLVGTSNWSWYGGGARDVTFEDTRFAGALVNLDGGPGGTLLRDCLVTNDPALGIERRAPYSPSGFLLPDAKAGVRFVGGEIRHAIPVAAVNGNRDGMRIERATIRATAGALTVYGRCGPGMRFVSEGGKVTGSPGGVVPGTDNMGSADAEWTWTANAATRRFPAVR